MNPVDVYAREVVDGLIPAGKYHRLACARHLKERQREGSPGFPYRFVWEQADRFLRFARKVRHYKGEWAGQFFEPSDNQVFRLGCIFGWRHAETGLRRFTTAYNEMPRKTGKTFEAAIVADYCTFFEGEPGAEGYCIATKLQQAKIVFRDAKKLVKSSGLSSRIKVNAWNLHRESTEQKLEPLGSDYSSTDGLNPHLIVTDEFHAMKTRDLIDVMESATGARRNPLHFQITTAGDDPVTPCGDQHDYACKILDGVLEDDPSTLSFFAFIAHADEGDDWLDERTWAKANPHYGISVNPEDMRKLAAKAKNMPAAAAEFKQKRLNIWVNASEPCLSTEGWRKGQSEGKPGIEVDELKGHPCYLGIDLASKIDLKSLSLVFPPFGDRKRWRVLQQIWTPEETLADRAHRDRAPYLVWRDHGWLTAQPGKQLSHRPVREGILKAYELYDVQRTGFDPWHVDILVEQLREEDGLNEEELVAVPQTFAGMSSACLRVQAEILEGNFDAGGCPVTAWAVANVRANKDGKDNLMFAKGKSRGRIDPVISLTIAVALWLRFQPVQKRKRQRGMRVWTPDGFVTDSTQSSNAGASAHA